jgi:hypothetical protein
MQERKQYMRELLQEALCMRRNADDYEVIVISSGHDFRILYGLPEDRMPQSYCVCPVPDTVRTRLHYRYSIPLS